MKSLITNKWYVPAILQLFWSGIGFIGGGTDGLILSLLFLLPVHILGWLSILDGGIYGR